MQRENVYFINGGAGRVLCSIPAFEKLYETTKNFIIVSESGTDFFKGHPTLDKLVFDVWHKNLFDNFIKDRNCITPEPYRVWEYYNQKCSISQAFDILINNNGIRDLSIPKIYFNKQEIVQGQEIVDEVRQVTGFDKVIVIQPFGREAKNNPDYVIDPSSRSFNLNDIIEIINVLKKEYAVIVMSEFPLTLSTDNDEYPVALPTIPELRVWASIIQASDYFLGCDSIGQHFARSLNKPSTIILGSTFPINVSYPNYKQFDIIDLGKDKRLYSPIRLTIDECVERNNDELMEMTNEDKSRILNSVRSKLGKCKRNKVKNKEVCHIHNTSKNIPIHQNNFLQQKMK